MKTIRNIIPIGIMIVLVVMIIISAFFPVKRFDMDSVGGNNTVGELKNGDVIEQEFITKRKYSKIGIPFANYSQLIDEGYVYITIINENNEIKEYKVKLSSIMNDEYYFIKYKFKKGQKYHLTLRMEGSDYPITIYTTDSLEDASLRINNNASNVNLRLAFLYNDRSYFNIWNYTFILVIVILYFVMFKDGVSNEKE